MGPVNTGPIGGCIFYHVIRDPVHMPVFPRSASHHSAYVTASDACSSQPIADFCVSAGRAPECWIWARSIVA